MAELKENDRSLSDIKLTEKQWCLKGKGNCGNFALVTRSEQQISA